GQRGQATLDQVAAVGGNTQAIGRVLYSEYLLPFEIASLILLVATIAAIVLGIPDRVMVRVRREAGFNISLVHSQEAPPIDPPDLDEPGVVDVDEKPVGAGGRRA